MERKEAEGLINWVDDELVGFKHGCGAKEVIVSIYEDGEYECECGAQFILQQVNTVFYK